MTTSETKNEPRASGATPVSSGVTVSFVLHPHGGAVDTSVDVSIRTPSTEARRDELGMPAVLDAVEEKVRASAEWGAWCIYAEQVADARAAIAKHQKLVLDAKLARELAERQPTHNFAEHLRRLEGEIIEAEAARATAERDLAKIEGLAPGVWCPLANAIGRQFLSDVTSATISVASVRRTADGALKEAVEKARRVFEAAIDSLVVEPLAEFVAASNAERGLNADPTDDLRERLIGEPPPGATLNAWRRWEVAKRGAVAVPGPSGSSGAEDEN